MKSHYDYELDGDGNRLSEAVTVTGVSGGKKSFSLDNYVDELECRTKAEVKVCPATKASELSGYSYDGAGEETTITGYSEPDSTTFSYDNARQLQTLTPPSGKAESLTYLSNGQSALTAIGTAGLQNSTLGLTKQVNAVGTSYYARSSSGLLIDQRLPGGANYNPVYDAQGDIIGLLNSSGELVQTVRYGPYGENTNATEKASHTAPQTIHFYSKAATTRKKATTPASETSLIPSTTTANATTTQP